MDIEGVNRQVHLAQMDNTVKSLVLANKLQAFSLASLRKGITPQELEQLRSELHVDLDNMLDSGVKAGALAERLRRMIENDNG